MVPHTPSGRPASHRWLVAETSEALIRAAQHGSSPELDALLRVLRPLVFDYFIRRVDRASADDLAQRTLWIIAQRYRGVAPEHASRWLVTVARNVVRDEFRRFARAAARHAPEQEGISVATTEAPEASVEYAELVRAVVAAAQTACPASLRVVVLGLVRGLDVSELARELGVSEPAVRVRLTRARAVLRRELRQFREASYQPRPSPSVASSRAPGWRQDLVPAAGER